jgi:hypothetical protein
MKDPKKYSKWFYARIAAQVLGIGILLIPVDMAVNAKRNREWKKLQKA